MSRNVLFPDAPDPDEWLRICAAACGMDFLPVLPPPSAAALSLLPRSLVTEFVVAPVDMAPDDFELEFQLCVALSDPLDFHLMDSLRYHLRRDLRFVVAPRAEIQRIISEFYIPNT